MINDKKRGCLPRKYSRECCVEYDCTTPGHNWKYVNRRKWILLSGKKSYPLTQRASLLFSNPEITAAANEIPIKTPLLSWFLRKRNPITFCSNDFSMVLNTIMKEQTFKPFEVITSACDGHVTMDIRGLPKYTPNWFYFSDIKVESYLSEFLLCMGAKEIQNLKLKRIFNFREELRFIRILHKFMPIEVAITNDNRESRKEKKFHVLLRVDSEIVNYIRGRVCGCVPIPGPSREFSQLETCLSEPEAVKSPEIVVVSPEVSESLKKLSQIWQDKFARTVLISAPPGSGKEALIKSIPYGGGRLTENFQVMSMADCKPENLQQRLYGVERNEGVYIPGLVALAKGSALFLDEIHEPEGESSVRANLLRMVEAEEYFAKNGIKPQKVENVLFVMATSKSLEQLGELGPTDFWTRMTYAIEIKHPLDFVPNDKKLYDVLSRFFNYFWWMRIKEFYGMQPVFGGPSEEIHLYPNKSIVFWQVHSMTQIMGFKCKGKKGNDPQLIPIDKKIEKARNFPFLFAQGFLDKCEDFFVAPKNFSIRGIRSMITQLFSIAASKVAQGQTPWYDEKEKMYNEKEFRGHVTDAFKEIVRMACIEQRNANVKSHNLRQV